MKEQILSIIGMSRKDKRFMQFIDNETRNIEPMFRTRMVSLIVIKNQIISIGYNQEKTDPFVIDFQKHKQMEFLHAETHAIKKALKAVKNPKDLHKATMYICRIKNNHNVKQLIRGLAKPCIGCQKAINYYGIRRVVYSLNNTLNCGEM